MKRGEIWTIAGTGLASKPRPALIIQDDQYALDSVTIVMLTSTLLDAPLYRVRVSATSATGLAHDSDVMIDKIMTVRRSNLGERVGQAPGEALAEVERLLVLFLGMG